MENTSQYDELLIKYLLNEANAEEEAFVVQWIHADERNRQYFEALQETWRLTAIKKDMEKVDVEQEWDHFKRSVDGKGAKVVSMNEYPYEYETVDEEKPARRSTVYRFLIAAAVAASVLLVLGLGFGWFTNKTEAPEIANVSTKKDSLLASVHHEVNTTGKSKRITLQDGTIVTLDNNSELSYPEPFTGDKRDITLTGKATFSVAKDKTKPFTVYSGDLSTTALGTEFEVTAFKESHLITVRLYEGKVVVKSVDSVKRKLKKDYYLLPGQELVYDGRKVTAKVGRFKTGTAVKKENAANDHVKDNPSIPKHERGSWFMFNNQPLDEVFEQLKQIYQAEIIYSKADVHKKYHIGKYNTNEPLESVLKKITILNDLTVTKEDNRYIISK